MPEAAAAVGEVGPVPERLGPYCRGWARTADLGWLVGRGEGSMGPFVIHPLLPFPTSQTIRKTIKVGGAGPGLL